MNCPHCDAVDATARATVTPIEGGRAYTYRCADCGHALWVRPHQDSDPPLVPADLTPAQIERLRFHRWRLQGHHDAA